MLIPIVLSVFYSKKGAAGPVADNTTATAAALTVVDFKKEFTAKDAILTVKEVSKERKFKESVEAIIRLNVDPR